MTKRKGISGGVIALIGLVVVVGFLGVSGNLSIGDQGQQQDMVNVNDWGVDGKVNFPTTPSSANVVLFEERPENYGNFADFDMANAKDGLEAGVDYREKTGVSTDSVSFSDLESGTYYLVVEDANYNTVFVQVEQPEQVTQAFADAGKAVKLADGNDMSTSASYGTDNVVSYDEDGAVLATGTDLPAPSSNGSQTVEIVRTIEVDTGVALAANLETTSFNADDGIESVDVEVTADGSQVYSTSLKDGASGELADSTSFGEDLRSSIETDPVRASDELEVTYTVTADMGTGASSAGDNTLQDGESILTTGLDDVYSNDISTATKSYTR
jgi:hypothetical protein